MKLTLDNLHMFCTEDGDCLIWKLGVNGEGKPQARLEGKSGQMVQRYVYMNLCERRLAEGRRVTAKCGNRLCVAPDHLIASTYGGILRRSYEQGARSTYAEYCTRLDRRIKHGKTVLTPELVAELRLREGTHAALAREFGLKQSTVARARRGDTWKNVHRSASVFQWRG